jgi:glycosyltransferase involved in cell wall biosynthesis
MVIDAWYTLCVKTIGIDCRFSRFHSGLGTFTRQLVSALVQRNDNCSYVLFVYNENEEWLRNLPRERIQRIHAPFAHYSFAEQFRLPGMIKKSGCDLVYFPHFNVPLFCSVPFVCTVHDLILHRFPNQSSIIKRLAYRMVLGHSLRASKAILTISEATKKDITHFYGDRIAAKTSVASLGIDERFHKLSVDRIATVTQKYQLHRPFLLYVGNCKQHKNVTMLVDAFKDAALAEYELVLVTGDDPCGGVEQKNGVRVLRKIDHNDLPALYSASAGFVTATLMEGFGLPLLEAMVCETPVLATHTSSIPEVCGGHALLSNPDKTSFTHALKKFVTDQVLRGPEKIAAAKDYAAGFRWAKTAEKLAQVLNSAVS